MKLLNKKAMTLFELLAVIVILGIIAAIAFPTVNRIINNNREKAFVEEANLFINTAKTFALDDKNLIEAAGDGGYVYYVDPTVVNSTGEADITDEFSGVNITDEFSGFTSDYKATITFKIKGEGDLIITKIYFKNDSYTISIDNPTGISTPLDHDQLKVTKN